MNNREGLECGKVIEGYPSIMQKYYGSREGLLLHHDSAE